MSVHINEEDVLPGATPRGTTFDLRHVQAPIGEATQNAVKNPGLIAGRQQDGGLVMPGGLGLLASEHQKTGHVLGQILDVALQHLQVVNLGGHLGRHRGSVRVAVRGPGRLRGRRCLDDRRTGQVRRQPAAALRQSDGDRVHPLDAFHVHLGPRDQAQGNLQHDLGADFQLAVDEAVERVVDHPVGRVLDGNHAQIRAAALDLLEHAGDGLDGDGARRQAELPLDGHVRERSLRAEIGDLDGLLQRQASAEHLLKHRPHRFGRKRTRVRRRQPFDNLPLPRRNVKRNLHLLLQRGDARDEARAAVQQAQELVVGPIDLGSNHGQLGGPAGIAGFADALAGLPALLAGADLAGLAGLAGFAAMFLTNTASAGPEASEHRLSGSPTRPGVGSTNVSGSAGACDPAGPGGGGGGGPDRSAGTVEIDGLPGDRHWREKRRHHRRGRGQRRAGAVRDGSRHAPGRDAGRPAVPRRSGRRSDSPRASPPFGG